MVRCISVFMNACYIARRNAITSSVLDSFQQLIESFHQLRQVFIELGVRASISLPRQHALVHYYLSIQLFGSPNGLCSSITESKHIKAVKEPWRRSSRYRALVQMLRTIVRMDKMTALRRTYLDCGMLVGTTSSYTAGIMNHEDQEQTADSLDVANEQEEEDEDDGGPVQGEPTSALFVVNLAAKFRVYNSIRVTVS